MKGKTYSLFFVIVLALGLLCGCTGSVSPTSPGPAPADPISSAAQYDPGRQIWGVWEVTVNGNGVTVEEISDRYSAGKVHFNVKAFLKPPYCSDCIKFDNVVNDETNQLLKADVTLKNPYPVSGADVRGIVISNIPEIYLANPDDYTDFYDGDDPADINPFRLFGKDLTDGIVGQGIEITEHFELHYDSTPFIFKTAVDAIYPTDSLREPYAIQNQTIEGVLDTGGVLSRKVDVEVLDRNDDTGTVSVTCEDLGFDTALFKDSQNANHYYGWVSNSNGALDGTYDVLISAADSVQPWILYDYLTVTVTADIGQWSITSYKLPDSDCPRDIGTGYDTLTGLPTVLFPGGDACDEITTTDLEFAGYNTYFGLDEIDPLIPGFSPYPVRRMDSSIAGGTAFFCDSSATYDDGFFEGPVSSLMITIFPGMTGEPSYINPGDGDAGRMYPTFPTFEGVDVTDDMMGMLYGLWADPEGVLPPEVYGLGPDYTRHDVAMGGFLPAQLVGDGPGKVSPLRSNLKAIEVQGAGFDIGYLFVLESAGSDCEIEVLRYTVDFSLKITTFSPQATIPLPGLNAVDLDSIMFNPLYTPNPDFESLAVLVQGTTGPYVKMFETAGFTQVDEIGSASEPILPGAAASLDCESFTWSTIILTEEGRVAVLRWVV